MDTANKKQPSETEADQAKRNLAAQEKMASWVPAMFGIGLAGILLTLAGVILIWRTLIHTRNAAIAARDQVKASREEFSATHRPEIIVHDAQEGTAVLRGNGKAIGASFTFFNKGTVRAQNVKICAVIVPINQGDELQPRIAMPFVREQPTAPITPGIPHGFSVWSDVEFERALPKVRHDLGGAITIRPEVSPYCVGTIAYEDGAGVVRQTGFCWRWEHHKWHRVTGNAYDYAY